MGMIKSFKNKIIGVDTSPFIYYIEENKEYSEIVDDFFNQNSSGYFSISTSIITMLEVLVLPYQQKNEKLTKEYEDILENSIGIEIIDVNSSIAKISSELRAKYKLRTPDAIQIATAIYSGADYFITNDIRLKTVKEIEMLTMEDLKNLLNSEK